MQKYTFPMMEAFEKEFGKLEDFTEGTRKYFAMVAIFARGWDARKKFENEVRQIREERAAEKVK